MAMMGEQFEANDLIGGMVLNLKPQFDKIAIWITNSEDTEGVAKIKKDIIKFLQIEDNDDLEYSVFKEITAQSKVKRSDAKRGNRGRGGRGGRGGQHDNNFNRGEFTKTN